MSDPPSETEGSIDSARPGPHWPRAWGAQCKLLFAVGPERELSQLVVAFTVWLPDKSPHSFVNISESLPLQVSPEDVCLARAFLGSIAAIAISLKSFGGPQIILFSSERSV